MKVKELQKTVNIAWSPQQQQPILLAAGTAAQQIDSSVNSTLEIYSTNLSDPSYDLALKAARPNHYRFQKLVWSPTGFGGSHPNGLIVGGCEGGHIVIYSAAKLLSQEEGLIAQQSKHSGAVYGLDFNPFQNNLLASCASESEIFIWDLNTTTHMFPGNKTKPLEDVKNVAWNRQVQHILASVFSTRCVIWDLRKNEQIIKLSDTQSRVRWHAIQWHPEVATQLWLASEDDQAPVLQLWDLRYATSPSKTIQVHQRGVLGMSWCQYDIDLMVSCGKDNRIYCWNPNTQIPEGEILSEVAITAGWYSDVQWCPRNPALIASSSLDGNVSIYSLFGGPQQQVQTSKKIADSFPGMENFAQAPLPQQTAPIVYQDLKYPPKWMKRPCGVAFGFGGKLVSFDGKNQRVVNISQVTTEPNLVERAQALTKSINEANFQDYCCQKADQTADQQGRILWYFIKANFERDPREEMLNLLGYKKEDNDAKFMKYVPHEVEGSPVNNHQGDEFNENVDAITSRISQLGQQQEYGKEDSQSVFDGIAATKTDFPEAESMKQFKIPIGDHPDSLITEAIFTGNIEAAVHLCMSSDRVAEALIIASTAGLDFLTKTQNQYLKKRNQHELSHLIMALVSQDWLRFIKSCTLDSWKEALVATLKHSQRKTVDICEKLGDRLLNSDGQSEQITLEYTRNAIICFVCAGSIDKLILAWYQLKRLEHNNQKYQLNTDELQELAEIIMLMNKSLEMQGIALDLDEKMANFIKEYSGLLVAQGAFTAALSYIMAIKAANIHPDLTDIQQRITNIIQPVAPKQFHQQQQPMLPQQHEPLQPFGGAHPSRPPTAGRTGSFSFAPPSQSPVGVPTPVPSHTPSSMMYAGAGGPGGVPLPSAVNPASNYQPPLPNAGWSQQTTSVAGVGAANMMTAPTPPPPTVMGSAKPVQLHHQPPANEAVHQQPPRPPSSSIQAQNDGGSGNIMPATSRAGNLHSRSKYVLDPSVAPIGGMALNANPATIPLNAAYNTVNNNNNVYSSTQPNPSNFMPLPTSTYNNPTMMYGNNNTSNPLLNQSGSMGLMSSSTAPATAGSFKPTPYGVGPSGNYIPGVMPIETNMSNSGNANNNNATICGAPPMPEIQKNPTPPPGWNDPPALKSTRQPKPAESAAATAPITHPLFGVDPNQNMAQNNTGYMDPSKPPQYQGVPTMGPTGMMNAPPPPPNSMISNPMQGAGDYMTPNNNGVMPGQPPLQNAFQPMAMNYQHQMANQNVNNNNLQQNMPPTWNTGITGAQQQQAQPATVNSAKVEAVKTKPPLPEEYSYLHTVLEELKTQCLNKATDPRTKRKFVDVTKRLENLYDCLRDQKLTTTTTQSLNQIVQYLQMADYNSALQTHTQIAFGSDFSQCAGFMPGLKVLIQSANELQVYLR